LFVAGTSIDCHSRQSAKASCLRKGVGSQREKVGDEPGLNSDGHRDVLNNLAGKTVRK